MMQWDNIPLRSPEQIEKIERAMREYHMRLDLPLEIVQNGDCFIARRGRIAGSGASKAEAIHDLAEQENAQLINPFR